MPFKKQLKALLIGILTLAVGLCLVSATEESMRVAPAGADAPVNPTHTLHVSFCTS